MTSTKGQVFFNALSSEANGVDPQAIVADMEKLLGRVHYSWFLHLFQSDTKPLQSLYVSALPEPMNQSLADMLNATALPLTKPVQSFFRTELFKKLHSESELPPSALPASTLNDLLTLPKRELIRLVGFLGLRDVASALKRVIDQKAIQGVREQLTEGQKDYLDRCMREQDPLPHELDLANWSGDQTALARLTQLHGMKRLGKALAGEHPSLLWHLARHLDRGRGELIIKIAQEKVDPAISERIKQQVADLYEVL